MGFSKSEEFCPLIDAIARSTMDSGEQRGIFRTFVSVLGDLDFDVWDELEGRDEDLDFVMREKELIGEEDDAIVSISKVEYDRLLEKARTLDAQDIPF